MTVLEKANPQSADTTWRRGVDGAVLRLSVNNRVATDAPYPVMPAAGYVAQAVVFSSVLSPLVDGDPGFREDITVEELEQALNAVLPAEFAGSGGGTVGAAPAVLVDAVQKAVEFGKTSTPYPTCTVDAAILLGVSYTEARGSWKNITSTGDMIPHTLSFERADKTDNDNGVYDKNATEDYAIGAFQITPGNWIGYRSVYPNADPMNPATWGGSSVGTDANGDGVADPNNVYDAAVGAWKMICKNAGSRDLITWGDGFIQSFGPYVGGGKWNSKEIRSCYNWGEMSWYDCTVILAKAKFDQATMFRVQLSLGAATGATFPPGFAGALEWAKTQYGAPYNGGGKYRFGEPWGDEPVPLRSIFPGSTQTYWFPKGTVTYDCSGFITTFFRRAGVRFPGGATSSRGMKDAFPLVAGAAAAQPGDLLISDFDINGNHSGRPSHVVLYIGNNMKVESGGSKGVYESPVRWDKVVWIVRPPMPQA
jgi:cell wall-associated NlpC family hydrolase